MAIRFEPMTERDYLSIGKEVKDGFEEGGENLPSTLNSTLIFGTSKYSTGENKPVCTDHMRGYIRLCKPVVNIVIARENGALLSNVLGLQAEIVSDVINFHRGYDVDEKAFIRVDEADSDRNVLFGGEIVKKWIDDFDISEAIAKTLRGCISTYAKKNKKLGLTCSGEFVKGTGKGFLAAGDWRFIPADECDYSGFAEFVGRNVFTSRTSRLSLLLNLEGHKERLYAMVLEYVSVLPIGMRPDIDGRHDMMSAAYNDVIAANKNLALVAVWRPEYKTLVDKYKQLSQSVYWLTVKPSMRNPKRKTILTKLCGKKGHIRSKMLGKRVDYSGRSVITIDPFLSIRSVKIPKDMLPKLYRGHILASMENPNPSDWIGESKRNKCLNRIMSKRLLEEVPVVIGRQPTLHKPSIRAFKPIITDDRSIGLNPLCVTGFNADFDGDQMHVRVPNSYGAIKEVRELMCIEQNVFDPKNGECSIKPRQEIVYGLNVCTRDNLQRGEVKKVYTDSEGLFNDLFMQEIKVSDTVTWNGFTECAGRVAFAACLPDSVRRDYGVVEVTSKSIAQYVEAMMERSIDDAIDSIDKMVRLGFKIAYLYPPTLNLLDDDDTNYSDRFVGFHEAMKDIARLYQRGMVEESAYSSEYDLQFEEHVEKPVSETIYKHVGEESGFVRLAASGARGSAGNLIQMYAYKGRIQKSANESFKAVVEHSYMEQLTPLEHLVTAYGGRQGLIAKSLSTADTGYAMRKMWHATAPYTIVADDCGTTEGITIKKSDIAMFADTKQDVDTIFCKILSGRYEAGTNSYIDKTKAAELCKSRQSVVIRSVITCKKPCCKKCYGVDPASHKIAALGLPIGIIAAQSIGQPGTQMSMDSFKKGGIASKANVTPAFTRLDAYIECRKLAENEKFGSYDPVAWTTGQVIEKPRADGTKTITIEGHRHSIRLPLDAVLKKFAVQGEGLCVTRGDYDINELQQYAGVQEAQLYLIHTLYNIYKNECEINMKHFEVLAAAMTMHTVIASDRKDLKVGQLHDSIQMLSGDLGNTVYVSAIKGIGKVQTSRTHALSRVLMEYVPEGLACAVLLGLEDPLEHPLNCIMMGQSVNCGGTGEFLDGRKM